MTTKETITDKLKTLAAGATLMAGLALGTGCDNAQQITKVPSEDVVNDDDEKPVDNNDTDDVISNNDKDNQPIDNNDKDDVIGDNDTDNQPIDNNDKDDVIGDEDKQPIENDDKDDKDDSDVNDNDPIENNDNNNNPSESDDSDNTNDSYVLWSEEGYSTKNLTQDQIDNMKNILHGNAEKACPYNYTQQPEQYDQDGNMYIIDKCEGNIGGPMWLENAAPKIIFDRYGVPPPKTHKIVSTTFNYSANGGQSNMKIRVTGLILDVNFVSVGCLSQGNENTSVIEMTPNATDLSAGCKIDGENKAPQIETKGAKQTKELPSEFILLCASMPNYQLDEYNNACSTTVNEFVWLENVVDKLIPKKSNGFWPVYSHAIKSVTRDLNTGLYYMDVTFFDGHEQMNLHITLNNAKSCMDQCHGKEGCTSHIEPTRQDASKGCFINGVEVNGEESAQRLKKEQHNLKHKTAPRFIKPAPAVAKQYYAKKIRPNRQKWLAQNVRNFGRNGR